MFAPSCAIVSSGRIEAHRRSFRELLGLTALIALNETRVVKGVDTLLPT